MLKDFEDDDVVTVPNDVLQIGSKFSVPGGRTGDVVNGKRVVPFDFIISAAGKNGLGVHNGGYCLARRDKGRLSLLCPAVVAAKQAAKKARNSRENDAPPPATLDGCVFRIDAVQNVDDAFATITKCNLLHSCAADQAHAVERQRKVHMATHIKGGDSTVLACLQPLGVPVWVNSQSGG